MRIDLMHQLVTERCCSSPGQMRVEVFCSVSGVNKRRARDARNMDNLDFLGFDESSATVIVPDMYPCWHVIALSMMSDQNHHPLVVVFSISGIVCRRTAFA